MDFPGSSDSKESACNAGAPGSIPGSGRSCGKGNGTPFLPGEFHGQRSLVGYSPWCCKESDTAEQLTHAHTHSWLTMLWQFQMNSKELSHRYICIHSPPSPPPIQNGILHWVEFMSCACSVVLVIHFDHGRVYMTFPNPLFFFFKLFIQLRLLLCEGFL